MRADVEPLASLAGGPAGLGPLGIATKLGTLGSAGKSSSGQARRRMGESPPESRGPRLRVVGRYRRTGAPEEAPSANASSGAIWSAPSSHPEFSNQFQDRPRLLSVDCLAERDVLSMFLTWLDLPRAWLGRSVAWGLLRLLVQGKAERVEQRLEMWNVRC